MANKAGKLSSSDLEIAICTLLKGHQHSDQAGPQSFKGTAAPDKLEQDSEIIERSRTFWHS